MFIIKHWHIVDFTAAAFCLFMLIVDIYAHNWPWAIVMVVLVAINVVAGIWFIKRMKAS